MREEGRDGNVLFWAVLALLAGLAWGSGWKMGLVESDALERGYAACVADFREER